MRCDKRWCWRKYQRIAHILIDVDGLILRFGQWYCHKHADEADARLDEARKTLGQGQWV